MVRILHVLGKLDIGGAESRIMDLYRNMDRNQVQFDFVVHGSGRGHFEDEIESLGGNIYRVPRFKVYNLFEYKNAWKNFLQDHLRVDSATGEVTSEFAMIQGHMTSTAGIYLPLAKKLGIKTTIAHARSAGVDAGIKGYLTRILRLNLANKADLLFTCSELAARSVFGQRAIDEGRTIFIPNCINVDSFCFDAAQGEDLRRKLGIEECFVVGHVGRFHYAKNHEYLIKVFRDLVEDWDYSNKDYPNGPVLVMVGDGPRIGQMKSLTIEYGLSDRIKFLGAQDNVSEYYNIMDCFVYPSRYEGLPGTVVEAQANGLPVIMSDEICPEVVVSDLVATLPINGFTDDWAKKIMDIIAEKPVIENASKRVSYNSQVKHAGFDVKEQALKMQKFYCTGEGL